MIERIKRSVLGLSNVTVLEFFVSSFLFFLLSAVRFRTSGANFHVFSMIDSSCMNSCELKLNNSNYCNFSKYVIKLHTQFHYKWNIDRSWWKNNKITDIKLYRATRTQMHVKRALIDFEYWSVGQACISNTCLSRSNYSFHHIYIHVCIWPSLSLSLN